MKHVYGDCMKAYDVVVAHGHPNIKATHRTTIEITKEEHLTPKGDCIIGVASNKSVNDLRPELKNILKRNDSIIVFILYVDELMDYILATGSKDLLLHDEKRLIIRKSTYIEPATIAIRSNKAARDIDRRIIEKLKDPATVLKIHIVGLTLDEIQPININVGSII